MHFGLDKRQTKYLNVAVYAKHTKETLSSVDAITTIGSAIPNEDALSKKETPEEEQKSLIETVPILLGHVRNKEH